MIATGGAVAPDTKGEGLTVADKGGAEASGASRASLVDHGDRLYYAIGQVATLVGMKPHILRFWETEFPTLRPRKNRAGNRVYRPKDVDLIVTIKRLLYEERFTIDGARRQLAAKGGDLQSEAAAKGRLDPKVLAEARASVSRVLAMLDDLE